MLTVTAKLGLMLASLTFLTLDSVKASFTLYSLNRKVNL